MKQMGIKIINISDLEIHKIYNLINKVGFDLIPEKGYNNIIKFRLIDKESDDAEKYSDMVFRSPNEALRTLAGYLLKKGYALVA